MTMTDVPPAEATPTPDLRAEYARRHLDRLSDAQLVGEVAARLSVPRENPADSFVLHAPLELAARAALLPHVRPGQREVARLRLLSLMTHFEVTGPAVSDQADGDFDDAAAAAGSLVAAIDRGELDEVDRVARWLGRAASPLELRTLLGPDMILRLSAAAHGPIFLYHLPRVAPRGEVTGELLRGLARELARYPDWRLHWVDDRPAGSSAPAGELFDAIAATPASPLPGSTFIFPLMSAVDGSGLAADALAEVTVGTHIGPRAAALLRASAWSMLLEPDDHAPYGWSHCLTMPQAVLGIADSLPDPSLALAVAATYVVGFRSPLAVRPLQPEPAAVVPSASLAEAIGSGRDLAAAVVWGASDDALPDVKTELATVAATAHDAHLVKYTLACLDAAAADPSHARLFLAAAASLAAWWHSHGNPDDPLA